MKYIKIQVTTFTFFRFILTGVLICFLISGAQSQHFYYGTTSQSMHFIANKGEGSFLIAMPFIKQQTGVEVQAAYAFRKYISGFSNFLSSGYNKARIKKQIGNNIWITEGGIGFHKQQQSGTIAQLLIGGGYVSVYNRHNLNRISQLRFVKSFIQPSIVFNRSDNIIGGISFRFTQVRLLGGDVDASVSEQEFAHIKKIENKTQFYIPELGFMIGLHFTPFTVRVHSNNFFSPTGAYNFARDNVSFALGYEFGRHKKKGVK